MARKIRARNGSARTFGTPSFLDDDIENSFLISSLDDEDTSRDNLNYYLDNKDRVLLLNVHDLRDNEIQSDMESERGDIPALALSIKNFGLISPIVVLKEESGEFKLYAGHRRRRAYEYLYNTLPEGEREKYEYIPAVLLNESYNELENKNVAVLIENLYREAPSPEMILNNIELLLSTFNEMSETEKREMLSQLDSDSSILRSNSDSALVYNMLKPLNIPGLSKRTIGRYIRVLKTESVLLISKLKAGLIPIYLADEISSVPVDKHEYLLNLYDSDGKEAMMSALEEFKENKTTDKVKATKTASLKKRIDTLSLDISKLKKKRLSVNELEELTNYLEMLDTVKLEIKNIIDSKKKD